MEGWWPRPVAGSWQLRTNAQLAHAFADFQDWCHFNRVHCALTPFSVQSLSMHVMTDVPMLKVKAANCLYVTRWLCDTCCHAVNGASSYHAKARASALWGFSTVFYVMQHGNQWLTDSEAALIASARVAALQGWAALRSNSHAAGSNFYPLKPKLHLFDHACRDMILHRENGVWHWVFADEDLLGKLKLLAQRCHLRHMGDRVLARWLMRYFATLRRSARP